MGVEHRFLTEVLDALAARLDVSTDTTRQWASGRREPPPDVLAWLKDKADALDSAPPRPVGWGGVSPGRRAVGLDPRHRPAP